MIAKRALLLIVVSTSLASSSVAVTITPTDKVVHEVIVRAARSKNSAIRGRLKPGDSAEVLAVVSSWLKVQLENGTIGFVSKGWVTEVTEPPVPHAGVPHTPPADGAPAMPAPEPVTPAPIRVELSSVKIEMPPSDGAWKSVETIIGPLLGALIAWFTTWISDKRKSRENDRATKREMYGGLLRLLASRATLIENFKEAKLRYDRGTNDADPNVEDYRQALYDYSSKLLVSGEQLNEAIWSASLTLSAAGKQALDKLDSFQDLSYTDKEFVNNCDVNLTLLLEVGAALSAAGKIDCALMS